MEFWSAKLNAVQSSFTTINPYFKHKPENETLHSNTGFLVKQMSNGSSV